MSKALPKVCTGLSSAEAIVFIAGKARLVAESETIVRLLAAAASAPSASLLRRRRRCCTFSHSHDREKFGGCCPPPPMWEVHRRARGVPDHQVLPGGGAPGLCAGWGQDLASSLIGCGGVAGGMTPALHSPVASQKRVLVSSGVLQDSGERAPLKGWVGPRGGGGPAPPLFGGAEVLEAPKAPKIILGVN